jgi:hypothetical protein
MKSVSSMESEAKPMANFLPKWQYANREYHRDLRVDYMRGFAMLLLIIVHLNMLSFYNYIAWERVGVVTGAEGFIALSGVVLGLLYRSKLTEMSFSETMTQQFNRAFLMYKVSIVVIIVVALLNYLPFVDASYVMTFQDYTGKVYYLYPDMEKFREYYELIMAKLLLLKFGPHQFQILNLYLVLIFFSPMILWLLLKQRYQLLLALSWIIYFASTGYELRATGAQFEYAFPVMTWQILFVHGVLLGYYRNEIWNFFHTKLGAITFGFMVMLFLAFLFFTYNNPIAQLSSTLQLSVIEPEVFKAIYVDFFQKSNLGIGRLLNDFVFLIVFYALLSYFWLPIAKLTGWFFVPIGQSSLYVFIIHIFLIILITNITILGDDNIWLNTLGQTLVLLITWLMVRFQVGFSFIPR